MTQHLTMGKTQEPPASPTLVTLAYDPSITIEDIRKAWTLKALAYHNGSIRKAAVALGTSHSTVRNDLKRWSLYDQYVRSSSDAVC